MNILPLETKGRMILDEFDLTDPKNIGRPFYFSLDVFIQSIEQMICCDEIQTALWMLDNPPGWYRDNYPQELTDIKNRIYQQCYDQFDYASDHDEANFTREQVSQQCLTAYTYPRANILFDDIKAMNENEITPWIFEISPSHGWLPVGFADRGLKFHFFGKNLNQPALNKLKEWLPQEKYWNGMSHRQMWDEKPFDQPKILVCFEALEHMWNPHDLEQAAKKTGISFDLIYLSTPKYTLGGGLPDWKTRRLGHIRTWTPKEFLQFADKSFPGFAWTYYDSHSMVIKGVKI